MYLVDGNNVIGGRVGWHRDKEGARRRLLEELSLLAAKRRIQIGVVFDGRPDPAFPDGSSYRGVRIYYAEHGSDADTRIVKLVEMRPDKKNMTVVTSDGGLTSRVRVCGVKVVRSGEFRRLIDEIVGSGSIPDSPGEKRGGNGEIDGWMRYFGVSHDDDDEGDW